MNSSQGSTRAERLISQLLLEDADLRDVVEEFVAGLETRICELQEAHQKLDFEALTTLAHRLKGAAGSYGYPDISQHCAEMEQRFRSHEADGFNNLLNELMLLSAAARAGLQEGP